MKLKYGILASALAFAIAGASVAEAATSSQIRSQFRNAVARVLNSVRNDTEFLRKLSNSDYRAFVACAQNVMNAAPLARMQYVLEARNLSEQRRRFDQVALEDRARLKQKITLDCA